MPAAKYIIGLGRGVEVHPNGYRASPDTLRRAAAIAAHFSRHRKLFESADPGLIVCSGSHAGLAKGQAQPPERGREGHLMADSLVRDHGVPHDFIEVELSSTDTFSNIINVARQHFFDGIEFNTENPLGLGAGLAHYRRAQCIARAAFNIRDRVGIRPIVAHGEDSALLFAQEYVGTLLTQYALAETTDDGVMTLDQVEEAAALFAETVRSPVQTGLAFATQLARTALSPAQS